MFILFWSFSFVLFFFGRCIVAVAPFRRFRIRNVLQRFPFLIEPFFRPINAVSEIGRIHGADLADILDHFRQLFPSFRLAILRHVIPERKRAAYDQAAVIGNHAGDHHRHDKERFIEERHRGKHVHIQKFKNSRTSRQRHRIIAEKHKTLQCKYVQHIRCGLGGFEHERRNRHLRAALQYVEKQRL